LIYCFFFRRSHLYSVFPGNAITAEATPLRDAAIRSMILRGLYDDSTGFSIAWKSNIWARLHIPSNAFRLLTMLLTPHHSAPNLFDLVDGAPFVIDANFGATCAVCEMLLQSQQNRIDLLPALPADMWPQGFVRGLRARGNYQVSIWWQAGQLTRAEIVPGLPSTDCRIRYGEKECVLKNLQLGYTYHLDASLQLTS
jgi:alpha-L-fucosidase 2